MLKQIFVSTALVLSAAVVVAAPAKKHSLGTTRSSSSYSSAAYSGNALQVHLGFGQSAVNFGGEFLLPANGPVEWGPYFFFYAEEDGARAKVLTIGGSAKIHYNANPWDIYVAPGFGFISTEVGNDDESTLGPSVRIGAMYGVTDAVSVGLEQQTLFNWFSDDIVGSAQFTTATVRFAF